MLSPIEQIKDRLDIVDLIGSYVKLEKAGRNYKARCPFHSEKTPSFIVSPDRQNFYCFGCQAKGDIFSFVEKYESLEFKEALKVLAERTGVELQKFEKEEDSKKEIILNVLNNAARFFENLLSNSPEPKKYVESRGLTEETVKKWRIGYSSPDWRVLFDHLIKEKFKEADIFAAGLIKYPEGGKRPYDVFRGRIMFPIFDTSGRVIAFSGRLFVDKKVITEADALRLPKYVNTPETDIFKKSEVLYGLNEAKSEIRRLDYSVLVEGQVDLVMSHQAGVKNTIASSGTALTESHLKKLQKLSNRAILAYDADEAGKNAAKRSGELALSIGMDVKIALLPQGEDPASLIVKDPLKWKEILKSSTNLVEFIIDESLRKSKKISELPREFNKSVIPLLSSISSEMLRSEYVALAAKKTNIREESIWSDLERFEKNAQNSESGILGNTNGSIEPVNFSIAEMISGLLFWQEGLSHKKDLTPNSFKYDEIRGRFETILGKEAVSDIMENSRFDKDTLIFEMEDRLKDLQVEKVADELLLRLEKQTLEKRLIETANLLDKINDPQKKEELIKETEKISKRISEINKN